MFPLLQVCRTLSDSSGGGYTFYLNSPTNQQFIILENCEIGQLKKKVIFRFWERNSIVRINFSFLNKTLCSTKSQEKIGSFQC